MKFLSGGRSRRRFLDSGFGGGGMGMQGEGEGGGGGDWVVWLLRKFRNGTGLVGWWGISNVVLDFGRG